MSLKLEIYLPNETVDNLTEKLQIYVNSLGDLTGQEYGNSEPSEDFDLSALNSFIIIKDEELPAPENFVDMDMYFVIPLGENNE